MIASGAGPGREMTCDIFIAHIACLTVNDTLLAYEKLYALGPVAAARVMGVAYVTYAQVRSGQRPLQLYHERHLQALMLLPAAARNRLIKEHANV